MILVTGSDGVVGRALCQVLEASNVPFLPLSHRRKAHTLARALCLDLTHNISVLTPFLDRLSGIVHLAAAVPHSVEYPDNEESAELTRVMDQNINAIQRATGVPLVYMSTCGLYNRRSCDYKCEKDESQIKILSPYFSAKADGESLFLTEKNTTVLRLAAPVGPGLKETLVLARFVALASADEVIKVWGSGKREQDFIDTNDVADLIISAIKQQENQIFNAASGCPTSMLELAESVVAVVGAGAVEMVNREDPREGETARYSIHHAAETLGWHPKTSLKESLRRLCHERAEREAK